MQVDKRIIESSLAKKGFIREETTHHTYFYHEYNGKRTGITAYTSHGDKIKNLWELSFKYDEKTIKIR